MKFTSKLVLVGALCVPAIAQACSCMAPPAPKVALEKSAAVFVGRVTSVEKSDFSNKYQFSVSKQWKGVDSNSASIVTATNSAACGINFDQDRDYLVYAFKTEGDPQLRTNLCSRTKRAADAATDLAELGAPVAYRPAGMSSPSGAKTKNFDVVQINTDSSSDPLVALSQRLEANEDSQVFRVNWKSPMNESFFGTALYNRNDSTLKSYSRAKTGSQIQVSSVLYSGVTDDVLQKLASTDKIEDFFRTYANYGVTKRDVGSKTVIDDSPRVRTPR